MGLLYYLKIRKTLRRINLQVYSVRNSTLAACMFCAGFLLFSANASVAQESLLEKSISIPKQHTTLYNALNLISEKTGCLFVYDSQIVESDKRVKLVAENQPLKQVLDNIIANPDITYKVIGEHILIYSIKKKNVPLTLPQPVVPAHDTTKNIIVKGHVFDNQNKAAMPFVSIGILEENIGTITNMDGYFTLKVPASLSGSSLVVSHMGYMSQSIPIQLLNEQKIDIFLERRIISLQEVIIRYIDPNSIVEKAMERRKINNSREPVYMTSFYREGVQKNKKYISYSEAVFKVYKSSFEQSEFSDQVKLLKSRKIQNTNPKDTVYVKLKAGVLSALQLDIAKCVPGFLDQTPPLNYTYTYSDMVSYNSKDAYAITFIQNKGIVDPLYTGTLYIDKESFAILGADFEINPEFLDKAADDLILKKSRKLIVKLEKISYSVSYTSFNGKYFLNHARCDIRLKTRLRNHLSYDNFNTFLELATCHIDTMNVAKFAKQEIMKPNIVFSEAPYSIDDSFWSDYNIIAPEENLGEALSRIIGKIEEIE